MDKYGVETRSRLLKVGAEGPRKCPCGRDLESGLIIQKCPVCGTRYTGLEDDGQEEVSGHARPAPDHPGRG